MSIFRFITIWPVIFCLGLTIIITIFWKLSYRDNSKINMIKLCLPFMGCRVEKGQAMMDCEKYPLQCFGSQRCCHDCHQSWKDIIDVNKIFTKHTQEPKTIYINNIFVKAVQIATITTVIIFFMQISLLILTLSAPNPKFKKCIQYSISIIGILIFLNLIGAFLYSIIFMTLNFDELLNCQPIFLLLVSWICTQFVWLIEYSLDILPFKKTIVISPIVSVVHLFEKVTGFLYLGILGYLIGAGLGYWKF